MLPLVCNDAVAVLFMFDLTRKATLVSIKDWYRQARGYNKVSTPSQTKPVFILRLGAMEDGTDETGKEEETKVGSVEYYKGFFESPVDDNALEGRGDGLDQALKLGGTVGIVLVVLAVAFLKSNDIF